jgi:D-glycerate 3-kinase
MTWLQNFMESEKLPASFAHTVEAICVPLARRVKETWAARGGRVTIGICGTQASGKSTAVAVTARLLAAEGLSAAVLSLDDLYLTHDERQVLAAEVHPLFATRGPPGTHDLDLGEAVLDGLREPGETRLPRFDKARDTRRPQEEWEPFAGPADVVLFEGWCVGAIPQSPNALVRPVNAMERKEDPDGSWRVYANRALAGPYQALFRRLDLLALLQAPGFETVLTWRIEQERKLRARMGSDAARVMSDAQIGRFIAHYERLTRHILTEMPMRADLVFPLDRDRRPLAHIEN